jgi:hypothetical protein
VQSQATLCCSHRQTYSDLCFKTSCFKVSTHTPRSCSLSRMSCMCVVCGRADGGRHSVVLDVYGTVRCRFECSTRSATAPAAPGAGAGCALSGMSARVADWGLVTAATQVLVVADTPVLRSAAAPIAEAERIRKVHDLLSSFDATARHLYLLMRLSCSVQRTRSSPAHIPFTRSSDL